jgi:uncharacterized C2H2 Zn-finger protein
MFKCSICGMEFSNVDEYVTHISKCAEQYKVKESKKKEEELKKAREVNSYIETIQRWEKITNDCKKEFKEKYPNEYDMNFKEKSCSCKKEPRKESFYGSVNGKECDDNMDEFIEKLKREWGEWLW